MWIKMKEFYWLAHEHFKGELDPISNFLFKYENEN